MNPERQRLLESFGAAPAALAAVLRRIPRRMWLSKNSGHQPSIHEIVWRLADSEAVEYVHCRRFIAEPDGPALAVDSSVWCGKLGYFYQDIKQALTVIRALRGAAYQFLKTLPDAVWSYTAEVPIYGRLSLDEWLQVRESYFQEQIRQMERIYSEWLEASSAAKTAAAMRTTVSVKCAAP